MCESIKRFSIILAFLVFCGFSLYAQSTVSVYVEAITGPGAIPENDAYYRNLLSGEVRARHYRLEGSADTADYTLKAMIGGPYTHNALPDPFVGYNEPRQSSIIYLFHLVLESNNEHLFIAEQNLLFDTTNTLHEFLPEMMDHVFALMPSGNYVPPVEVAEPETEEPKKVSLFFDPPEWRDKWLFLGLQGLGGYLPFENNQPLSQTFPYGGGFLVELGFLDFLSLETGLNIVHTGITDYDSFLDNLIMEFPLMVRLTLNPPSHKFVFGPFGGVRANLAIPILSSSTLEPSLLSWFGGMHYEGNIGPGSFFAAISLSKDLFSFKLDGHEYNAGLGLRLNIGYKIGLIPK